jgi:hypothetical protein
MAGARVQPVALALEDVHWADPTTRDVLRGHRGARGLSAAVCCYDRSPRVPTSMEHALESRHDRARSARPRSGSAYGRGACSAARLAQRIAQKTVSFPLVCRPPVILLSASSLNSMSPGFLALVFALSSDLALSLTLRDFAVGNLDRVIAFLLSSSIFDFSETSSVNQRHRSQVRALQRRRRRS